MIYSPTLHVKRVLTGVVLGMVLGLILATLGCSTSCNSKRSPELPPPIAGGKCDADTYEAGVAKHMWCTWSGFYWSCGLVADGSYTCVRGERVPTENNK